MTSESLRRVGVPIAVALAVLALVLGVVLLVDQGARDGGGSGTGSPGAGGGGEPGSSGDAKPPSVAPGGEPTADPDAPMSRFTAVTAGESDTSVDVRFWGGVEDCYRYTVVARETDETVTLSLREKTTFEGACIDLAQEYERTIRLDEPLGVRVVLDAVTGESLLAPSP